MIDKNTAADGQSTSGRYWSELARLGFHREDWVAEVGPGATGPLTTVPYAMIGCGLQATSVVSPSAERVGFHLAGVCDTDRGRAERATHGHPDVAVYTDYEDLLRSTEAGVVFVCGPPSLHHAAGLAVLGSGRHLFVEKPPAWHSIDVGDLQEAAERAERKVMVGLNKRHAPLYRHAKDLLETPPYGPAKLFRMSYSHWPVPDLRDHLFFFSIHAIDLCLYFMGPIKELAIGRTEFGRSRSLSLYAEHENGSASQVVLNTTVSGIRERLELSGDEWLISVDDLTSMEWSHGAMMSTSTWRPQFAVPGPSSDSYLLAGYVGEMAHFHQSILSNRDPDGGLTAARSAIEVLESIMESPEGISHRRNDMSAAT